jgi:hypothetical protein
MIDILSQLRYFVPESESLEKLYLRHSIPASCDSVFCFVVPFAWDVSVTPTAE